MLMEKLFVDYDGVIVNTIEAIVEMYDREFWQHPDYHKVDWSEIESWHFDELNVASPEHIDKYFEKEEFFEIVEYMPYADYILSQLKNYFQIYIISMGNGSNLTLKKQWCQQHLPFAEFIGIDFKDYPDKRHINMRDSVFIDDVIANLNTSNAQKRICFGDKYAWNKDWSGDRCANWFEVWKKIGLPKWRERKDGA